MGMKVNINGKFFEKEKAMISIFDHGFLYGDGVFEGIRSYSRCIFRLDEHLDRLFEGAEALRLQVPLGREGMKKAIVDTLKENGLDDAYIRLILTRGVGDLGLDPRKCRTPGYFVITDKIALYPKEYYEKGLAIITAKTRRNHPNSISPRIKSLNYLNNILGKIEAIDAGTEEALMLTVDDFISECTGDNIFIVKDESLFTPPSEIGALNGVTQRTVIEIARDKGMDFSYRMMKPEDVYRADECFLTGTAAEIIPVVKLDSRTIGSGMPGHVTRKLLEEFHRQTRERGLHY